ncbi:hypothetical protein PCASD_17999 [Puccinia coronata f. sp. avenae]|uniref:Uncharacterized protein n=2 Tax=Puccinia coronata f. sp. avenae TaxID=200324 RepID=A0A2N5U6E7_9BASI|nr:hypothetical protein PCASD_17999 [Puccinia coronata f. sp. avenae]
MTNTHTQITGPLIRSPAILPGANVNCPLVIDWSSGFPSDSFDHPFVIDQHPRFPSNNRDHPFLIDQVHCYHTEATLERVRNPSNLTILNNIPASDTKAERKKRREHIQTLRLNEKKGGKQPVSLCDAKG